MSLNSDKTYQSLPDEALMSALSFGNVDAFNVLYQRYQGRLLYYFYRMLGNSQEKAQDFLQDIFVKVIERPELFDSSRRFSTWIFSVAHNMCKNEYRSLKVREIMTHIDNVDCIADEQDSNKDENKLLVARVYNEIANLDESDRTVFLMRYHECFSVKVISQVLDIPEGTVKSKLFYIRKNLVETIVVE